MLVCGLLPGLLPSILSKENSSVVSVLRLAEGTNRCTYGAFNCASPTISEGNCS